MLMQYQLFTALVFDEWFNGVPGAFALCSRATADDIARWMQAINDRCKGMQADWQPSSYIVDDCDAEMKAIRYAAVLCMLHKCCRHCAKLI